LLAETTIARFCLPVAAHVAIAAEHRQHVFMTEILRPRLVFIGRPAELATEKRKSTAAPHIM
jgi:hypothetical protein